MEKQIKGLCFIFDPKLQKNIARRVLISIAMGEAHGQSNTFSSTLEGLNVIASTNIFHQFNPVVYV